MKPQTKIPEMVAARMCFLLHFPIIAYCAELLHAVKYFLYSLLCAVSVTLHLLIDVHFYSVLFLCPEVEVNINAKNACSAFLLLCTIVV
ncbi:hypothetical protein EB796_022982 [Bugula neritina]|uniref:Uncharacterized protein n=1 Tax=Bugula neritina TaxID=10212 RepID=A0A7J7IZQ7_BUGNE|nr:hypothetical protein EB796_022982 [Bugula neritina]